MALLIFFIVFIFLNSSVFINSLENCTGNYEAPVVSIRDLLTDQFPSIKSVDVNQAVGQNSHFQCTHSQPVQWSFNIVPTNEDSDLRMTRSFSFKRILKKGPVLNYTAYFGLLYSQRKLPGSFYLACESSCGDVTMVEMTKGRNAPSFNITQLKPNQGKMWRDRHAIKIGNKTRDKCEMILQFKLSPKAREGNKALPIFYRWREFNRTIRISKRLALSADSTTDQGVYYRNVFRNIKKEPGCVEMLPLSSSCPKCKKLEPQSLSGKSDDATLNTAVFYAKTTGNVEMAFKGLFSVHDDADKRRFYWDWEVQPDEMVYFNPPSVIWVGRNTTLNCSVSTIYFAYGTLIITNDSLKFNDSYQINLGETETFQSDGRRVVNKTLIFNNTLPVTANLSCSAPLWNWERRIVKSKRVLIDIPYPPMVLNGSKETDKIIFESDLEYLAFNCKAFGKPIPKVEWILPQENFRQDILINYTQSGDDQVQSSLMFPELSQKFLGTYNCVATNEFGETDWKAFSLVAPPGGLSKEAIIGISTALGVIVLTGLLTIAMIYRRIILQRREYQTKTEEAIKEFKEGMKMKLRNAASKLNKHQLIYEDSIEQQRKTNPHLSILELPYDDRFEVERCRWTLEDTCLGQGTFGYVRKGVVSVEGGGTQTVAVKTLKSSAEIEDFKSFLTELKIMAYIGHHPNVVSLVAACTENIEQRDVMIGVEFCSNGSLMDYLREKRGMFQSSISANNHRESRGAYANLMHSVALTEKDLYTWSYQIAQGMDFLSSKNVLHGDLATRNVLLTSDKMAKISDFGLSRILLNPNMKYTKKSRVPLPWKWMALESLKHLMFSPQSDVWAYGVTLWEIFTLGEVPWQGQEYGDEFIAELENGLRLPVPTYATEYLYDVMANCWAPEPDSRLTFSQLRTICDELLSEFQGPGRETERHSSLADRLRRVPVATPRTRVQETPWYSNKPAMSPNLYLNV